MVARLERIIVFEGLGTGEGDQTIDLVWLWTRPACFREVWWAHVVSASVTFQLLTATTSDIFTR